jgi:cardiolipin synthase A/B
VSPGRSRIRWRSPWVVGVLSALATLLATVIVLNFSAPEKQIEEDVPRLYGTHDAQFLRAMGVLLGPQILGGNRYATLSNGDQIFPAMLRAIREARRTITFETYIYWSGSIGEAFADALVERARAGVKVHVLLDWVGSVRMKDELLARMRDAGIEIERFHEPEWYALSRLNNRTHRKVLVVDGRIGFTGGVGIGDEWSGNAQDPKHWRDTHYVVEGPVVAQMQAVFMDNWTKATGRVLHGADYFPALSSAGDGLAQMFMSSPTGGSESMHLMYLLGLAAANRTITLSQAYFVPEHLTVRALVAALKRGVRVRILTGGKHMDSEVVRRASRARWGELLEAGAEIYEYQPTLFHNKIMVVDTFMVSVGSTNFDNRSFQLNDEANLNVFDPAFAREQEAIFEQDLARSTRITLDAWRARPFVEKLMEQAAGMFSAQL